MHVTNPTRERGILRETAVACMSGRRSKLPSLVLGGGIRCKSDLAVTVGVRLQVRGRSPLFLFLCSHFRREFHAARALAIDAESGDRARRDVPFAPRAAGPASINAGGVTIDLKTQLEKGLKARRPVEFAYIDQIISLVESGKLPRSLVTSTFVWARQRPTRQLQYFQFALAARAKGLAVQLPDLRNQAVGINTNGGEHGVTGPQ